MKVDEHFMRGGYHRTSSSGELVIRDDLMTTHAQAYGELFASRDRRNQVSSSQLRAFYGDVNFLSQAGIPRGQDEVWLVTSPRTYFLPMAVNSGSP